MSTHSQFVRRIAERATARAVHLVIRRMRALDKSLLSGEDSGLCDVREEVCVQVQVEHSSF